MTLHSSITDPNVHEPKGISTAAENSIYVANGEGTGFWTAIPSADPALVSPRLGTVTSYVGTTAPSKWLLCYGQAISRTTYANLFELIGTTYGVGDGSTTFNIPDIRGRVVAGRDAMGGPNAGRLASISGELLGVVGGEERNTLTSEHVPTLTGTASAAGTHSHSVTNGSLVTTTSGTSSQGLYDTDDLNPDGRYSVANIGISSSGSHSHTVTVNSGGGDPHNNLQPTTIFNKIIFHGVE